jgi:signal peptidase I
MNNNILIEKRLKSRHFKKKDSLDFNRKRKKIDFNKWQRIGIFVLEVFAVILFAYLIVRAYGIREQNLGESMEKTLGSGDYVLVDRICYKIRKPKVNDIVVFKPKDSGSNLSVKRIVAVPGDKVIIKDGILYVNGKAREEESEYINHMEDAGLAEREISLSKDQYFVLGDNRNNSVDSRYDNIGNISKKDIVGKAWFDLSRGHFGIL